MRVVVIDMQPIEPPLGGGRLRLFGLYHALGMQTTYVGTFDWPGESPRNLRLSPTLTEIDVPLSPEHFACDELWRGLAAKIVIDTTFPIGARHSPGYVNAAREAIAGADVIVMSHPWVYPLVSDAIDRSRQLLVYDAQNAESLLRWNLLGDAPLNREVAKGVAVMESILARASDLVVACSAEDGVFFANAFDIDTDRIAIVPNGVFTRRIEPASASARRSARASLGLSGPVVMFLGSPYPPNLEAAHYIAAELCPRFPGVTFACCGGVGEDASAYPERPANFLLPGVLGEAQKLAWLHAADVALNPMFNGSGTNIKMFDFMAAGLPVVSTPVGARGIATGTRGGIVVADIDALPAALEALLANPSRLAAMGRANRAWVAADYSWERISPAYGERLRVAVAAKAARKPSLEVADAAPPRGSIAPHVDGPVAIMTTWGIACGIAEYTAHLCEALEHHGVPLVLLSNEPPEGGLLPGGSHEAVKRAAVHPTWCWDNLHWTRRDINFAAARAVLVESGATAFNIQHHPAFYPDEMLLEMVAIGRSLGLPVTVTLHNSNRISDPIARELVARGAVLLVHKGTEFARLERDFAGQVKRIAFGMPNAPRRRVATPGSPPVISTFGFLRPHKGLMELLEAMPVLRRTFPGMRLVAKCAHYEAYDATNPQEKILAYIDSAGLADCVDLDARFLDLDSVVDALAATDLIVLPYAKVDEGASGSLASVMAACRPVVVARSPIFDDSLDQVYVAESNHPMALAAAVSTVLANPDLQSDLESRMRASLARADWKHVALDFLATFDAARGR